MPTANVDPERGCHHQELQAPGDEQPADEDDGVGQDHPRVGERRPPEVERLGPRAAEHDERDHQPEVRRVEQVRAAVLDGVLGEQRERRDAGEHVPLVEAPVVAERGARDAEDEGDAAAGEHRTCRPHEGAAAAELDGHVEDRSGEDGSQDLRNADPEVQADLAEHVERDDHGRHVQSRVAQLGQHHRVRAPTEVQRPCRCRRGARRSSDVGVGCRGARPLRAECGTAHRAKD